MGTVRGDPVTYGETFHTACLQYHASVAVAQRERLLQFMAHRLQGGDETVGAHLVQHLTHSLWLGAGFLQEVGSAELHQHSFSTSRDQRGTGANQQLTRGNMGRGYVHDFCGASFKVLEYLLHV